MNCLIGLGGIEEKEKPEAIPTLFRFRTLKVIYIFFLLAKFHLPPPMILCE